jgi:hypothetical protein
VGAEAWRFNVGKSRKNLACGELVACFLKLMFIVTTQHFVQSSYKYFVNTSF